MAKVGITLIAADSPDAFLDDTPTAVMLRQILGSVSQFEKAMLVAKLKGAARKRSLREIAAELEAQGLCHEEGEEGQAVRCDRHRPHGGGFSCAPEREGLTRFKYAGSDA